jgi:ssRNA-specific RNase YbeY (16S rRNA maturation enzyme)
VCPDVAGAGWRSALVHGVLHLIGYDHGAEMTAREAEYA